MPSPGFLIALLLFLAVAIYLTDFRAFEAGRLYGRAELEAERERGR